MVSTRRILASAAVLTLSLALAPQASAAGITHDAGWWSLLARTGARIALVLGISTEKSDDDGRASADGNG